MLAPPRIGIVDQAKRTGDTALLLGRCELMVSLARLDRTGVDNRLVARDGCDADSRCCPTEGEEGSVA